MNRNNPFALLCFVAVSLVAAVNVHAAEHVKLVVDYGNGVQKHFTQLEWKEGLTVLDATQLAGKHERGIEAKVRSSGATAFLTEIDDVANEGASGRNWVYRVNGKLGTRSCGIQKLNKSDTVLWRFQRYE